MQTYEFGPDDWSEGNPYATPKQPEQPLGNVTPLFSGCETTPEQPQNNPKTTPRQPLGKVSFSIEELAEVAQVSRQALRVSWLPHLEKVAPNQVKLAGRGRYSRRAMELIESLRCAKDDGKSPEDWVAEQPKPCMDEETAIAVEVAHANGAIVPVEVLDAVATGASQIVQAQQQANLALSLVDAVLTGIHDQQQAYSAQSQAFDIERIRAQAAIKYAVELQVEAQVRAEMDAKIAANKQAAIEAQLQRFQGGER